ncbi:hypothetical protein K1X76_10070 [bacterium]|nr:hypothetical protein [bacterium]
MDSSQKLIQKEKRIIALSLIEKNRTHIEKFKVKKMGGWGCLPLLLSFLYVIGGAIALLISGKKPEPIFFSPLAMLIPAFMTYDIHEEWNDKILAKERAAQDNPIIKDFVYQEGYIYLDSQFKYWTYKIGKSIGILISCIIITIAIVLLFTWVSGIHFDKSTVIIILLVIIILNQIRGK